MFVWLQLMQHLSDTWMDSEHLDFEDLAFGHCSTHAVHSMLDIST
jgi:hypothetical protein